MPIDRITSEPGGECFIVTFHYSGVLRLPSEIQRTIQIHTLQVRHNDDSSISIRGLDRDNLFGKMFLYLLCDQQVTPVYLLHLREAIRNMTSRLSHDDKLLSALNFTLAAPIIPVRIDAREGLISIEDSLRIQMQISRNSAQAAPIQIPQENKYALILSGIKNFDFDSIPAHFCCPLSLQIMDDPVIDSTTLIPGVDPNKPAKNYNDVARYDRKWLERAIATNGKSPTTRQTITTPLIADALLKSQIDAYVKAQVDAYESRVMHHVIGDLYFKIELREQDASVTFTHNLTVIQNGRDVVETMLKSEMVEKIIANIRDIKKLKLIMLSCGDSNIPTRIIRCITDAANTAKQSSSLASSYAAFLPAPAEATETQSSIVRNIL